MRMPVTQLALLFLLVVMETQSSSLDDPLMKDIRNILSQEKLSSSSGRRKISVSFKADWPKVLWGIGDTTAVVGRIFRYTIPIGAFRGKVWKYQVTEAGHQSLPSWLYFNSSSNSFHGVPVITDQGATYVKVTALGHPTSEIKSVHRPVFTIFAIRVEASKDPWLSAKNTGAIPLKSLQFTSGGVMEKDHPCSPDESIVRVTLVINTDITDLTAHKRVTILHKMSQFLSKNIRWLTISPKRKTVDNMLMRRSVLVAGPGNAEKKTSKHGVELTWHVACGYFQDIKDFTKVIEHNVEGGRISHEIGYSIIGWYIVSTDPPEEFKRVARIRRQAVRGTLMPTPTVASSLPSKMISTTLTSSIEETAAIVTSLPPFPTDSFIGQSSESFTVAPSGTLSLTDDSILLFSTETLFSSITDTDFITSSPELVSTDISEMPSMTTGVESDIIQPSMTSLFESEPLQSLSPTADESDSILPTLTDDFQSEFSQSVLTSVIESPGISETESIEPTLTLVSSLQTESSFTDSVLMTPSLSSLTLSSPDSTDFIQTPELTVDLSSNTITIEPTSILESSSDLSVSTTTVAESISITDSPVESDSVSLMTPIESIPMSETVSLFSTPSIETFSFFPTSSITDVITSVVPTLLETYSLPTDTPEFTSSSDIAIETSEVIVTSSPEISYVTEPVQATSALPSVSEFLSSLVLSSLVSSIETTDISSVILTSMDVSTPEISDITSQILTPSSTLSSGVITPSETISSSPEPTSMIDTSMDLSSDIFSTPVLTMSVTTSLTVVPSTPMATDVQSETVSPITVTESPLTSYVQMPYSSEILSESASSLLSTSPTQATTTLATYSSTPLTESRTPDLVTSTVLMTSLTSLLPTPTVSSSTQLTSDIIQTSTVLTTPSSSVITTTPTPNKPPVLVNPLDKLVVSQGIYFSYTVPADTFFDPEDGDTSKLKLNMLTLDRKPLTDKSWVQFNSSIQAIYGVALANEVTPVPQDFLLVAEDSGGLRAYDAFQISFNTSSVVDLSHSFMIGINIDYTNFTASVNNRYDLLFRIGSYYSDDSPRFMTVSSLEKGSVVLEWSNNTLSKIECQNGTIDYLFSLIAASNGTVNSSFASAMEPRYTVMYAYHFDRGVCVEGNGTVVLPVLPPSAASVNVIVVVAVIVIILILLLCLLLFCIHRKRKRLSGQLLLEDEKPIFAKNRKPIYMDGEMEMEDFNEKPKRPVMMLEDGNPVYDPTGDEIPSRPAPPPYQIPYDGGFGGVFDSLEDNLVPPPDYSDGSLTFRQPPPYRLPPPYIERPSSSDV